MTLLLILFLFFPEITIEWETSKSKKTVLLQGFLSALLDAFQGEEGLMFHYKSEPLNEED